MFELSGARAEAGKHAREAWGGLTKSEREELKGRGEEAVSAHLEAARLDPELVEFRETTLEECDDRIAELSGSPQVLDAYKNRLGELKETLAHAVSYEHLRQEEDAVTKAEEKLRKLYNGTSVKQVGRVILFAFDENPGGTLRTLSRTVAPA